jgi:hypothetical protein
MKNLTSSEPNSLKTVVDVYTKKQQLWINAMKEWDKAKQAARGSFSVLFSGFFSISHAKY